MMTIEILNLKCAGCANTVKKGVITVEGVNEVHVEVEASKVTIDSEDEFVLTLVKKKLASMGYPEVGDDNTIVHKAKSFVSCATGRITLED
ncbi:heavy-metal-associated domain-containing protein [Lutibacter sp.]